jgi:hypothetical protein
LPYGPAYQYKKGIIPGTSGRGICRVMHRNFNLEIQKRILLAFCVRLQVIDFKGFAFCLRNGHPVETRLRTAFGPVKGGIIHKVIHTVCGYLKKFFKYGYLA